MKKKPDKQPAGLTKDRYLLQTNTERLVHIKRQESLANLFGVNASSISPKQAQERWPLMNIDDVIGAVWSPDDGRVSPSDLCSALIKGAKLADASVFEDTAVIGIITENNKIKAVETNHGTIKCDAIALCTGLWSKNIGAMAGVDLPIWPCEHFYLLTKPIEGISGNMPTLSDHDSHLYIRDDSGGLLVGCFEPLGKPINPDLLGEDFAFQLLPEDWDHFEPMMINALHRLPCLETAEVKMLLNGPESFTPDGAFLLGESAETNGFFLGCGMNSVGVATGGGAGMALAHCIINGQTPTDLYEVDPKRFPACLSSLNALTQRVPEVLGKHYEITFPGRQWRTSRHLSKTPLHDQWLEEKAHFGQYFGYERPLYFNKSSEPELTFSKPPWFDQVGREVMHAHTQAAIFDQSSFGKISVIGCDAESFMDRLCTNNMEVQHSSISYTLMLNHHGGIESDLTVMRLSSERYRLYVGTTAIKKVLAWLQQHIKNKERIRIVNETDQLAILGLMGPMTAKIAKYIKLEELNNVLYFNHQKLELEGNEIRAAKLSYVGESGWEITCKSKQAPAIYQILKQAGAKPSGLFAQTSMRIEKRFLAYGHELDTDITPLETGLGFAIDWGKEFIGHEALTKQRDNKVEKNIVTLLLNEVTAVPIGGEPVYAKDKIIGKTTSASFGYRINKPVALALISTNEVSENQIVEIDIAGEKFSASVTRGAAFDPTGKLMKN